jgi:hypothetical protein
MTINYRLSDVDAAGATIRACATAPEAEQEFIIHPGHSFQVIHGQANERGPKAQTAQSNIARTDRAVGASWA